jgi:hypothetical protein
MNPLMVVGRVRKQVDSRLIDFKPIADGDFFADAVSKVVNRLH